MKLSVIVPAYNEAATITAVLKQLLKQKDVKEIVVVDDASTDQTYKLVTQLASKKIRLLKHRLNQGKGAAVTTGLTKVTGDYVLIQDADLEYDPEDISSMMAPIVAGKAEVVYGSRFTGPRRNMYFWHMLGNKLLNLTVNVLFDTTLSDMETCYKILPTALFRDLHIQAHDFAIEPEITCKVLKRGILIFETPISYTGRTFAQGKKIMWQDWFIALFKIVWIRFVG